MNKGFLTIAYGNPKYIRMGKALARSIRHHSQSASIAVITDHSDDELKPLFDIVIPINKEYGEGVKQKLFLDLYTPFDETIFIDSDCLTYKNPENLWEMYKQYKTDFAIKGWRYIRKDDNHYLVRNLGRYLSKHKVDEIGFFNSGIFYFNSSKKALAVFETARNLCADDELRPFKNSSIGDEPVIAMAMELNKIKMLPWDNGKAMVTALGDLSGQMKINVLDGESIFIKNGKQVNPIVIHFNVECQDYFIYLRDIIRLELISSRINLLASIIAFFEYIQLRIRKIISTFLRKLSRIAREII